MITHYEQVTGGYVAISDSRQIVGVIKLLDDEILYLRSKGLLDGLQSVSRGAYENTRNYD